MGTLICEVKLSKTEGIVVTVTNEDGGITQTIHMDGTAITTTVKGKQETSTITQTQEKIHVKVKEWVLDAETITCTSTKATKHESKDIFSAKSAKNMTLETQQNLSAKATANVDIKGNRITTSSTTDSKLAAGTAMTIEGKTEVKVSGLKVTVEGQAQADFKGGMVGIKAQGILNAEASGIANLKGAMTNIGGSLVKVG